MFTNWLDNYVDGWGMTDGLSLWLLGASIVNDATQIDKLDAWTHSKKPLETPSRRPLPSLFRQTWRTHPVGYSKKPTQKSPKKS